MTESKQKSIPPIPPIPDGIIRASQNGELVVFVGAGTSKIIGCPSWGEFAKRILKDIYERPEPQRIINFHEYENLGRLHPRKLLSICKQIDPTVISKFKTVLLPDAKLRDKFLIYQSLLSWKAIYVTTNFDDCFDQELEYFVPEQIGVQQEDPSAQSSIQGKNQRKVVFLKAELLVNNLKPENILHLHGSVKDESTLIVTTIDYLNHYQAGDSNPVPEFLSYIFKKFTVLFLGYGLEEYEILEYIISKSPQMQSVRQHFMLYPMFEGESNILKHQRKYYENLGVELIPYLIDDNGYEQLDAVIKKWGQEIGPIARPQGFIDKIKLIDEVVQ